MIKPQQLVVYFNERYESGTAVYYWCDPPDPNSGGLAETMGCAYVKDGIAVVVIQYCGNEIEVPLDALIVQ